MTTPCLQAAGASFLTPARDVAVRIAVVHVEAEIKLKRVEYKWIFPVVDAALIIENVDGELGGLSCGKSRENGNGNDALAVL